MGGSGEISRERYLQIKQRSSHISVLNKLKLIISSRRRKIDFYVSSRVFSLSWIVSCETMTFYWETDAPRKSSGFMLQFIANTTDDVTSFKQTLLCSHLVVLNMKPSWLGNAETIQTFAQTTRYSFPPFPLTTRQSLFIDHNFCWDIFRYDKVFYRCL